MSIHLRVPMMRQCLGWLRMPGRAGFPRGLLVVLLVTGAGIGLARADSGQQSEPQTHWSFRPIRSPVPPVTRNGAWVKSPIDAFILRKLEDEGLEPAPAASRLVWLRRASFDLLGLPPSPDEIERFLGDERPDAYDRLIDRLLASPQYGERWGRHWLDVVRYADTGGFEADLLYARAWWFRDYVIRSVDADKPFDRFIQEQVAGDELWPDDPDSVLGSTLYSVGPALSESAMVAGQLEYEWLTDAADTTGEAFLGLSFGCARCHNHKYDPIRQTEYYAMQAIFAASDRPYPEKVRLNRIKAINGLLAEVPVPKILLDDPRCTLKTEDQAGFRLFHRSEPLVIHRLHRGEWNKPQEVVEPGFPAVLMTAGRQTQFGTVAPTKRRAALARWLTSPENPMVARVLVNRVWGWHFARAIVRTPNDFGKQGEEPTHPELLDFLARELIGHGWSLKHLHRLIMLSNTYRMSSVAEGPAARKDPENLWLGHFPRRRLEGEEIRDAMLACAGELNAKRFGEPVVPPLSREELTGLFDAKDKWPVTEGLAEHTRRSVYLLVRRTFVYPMFSAFDPPELMTSCARRLQTIVPAQALALLNSPLTREQSAVFAKRILRESGGDREKALRRGWLLAYGRPITQAESDRALRFLGERTLARTGSGKGSIPPSTRSAKALPAPPPQEAAMAELCRVLFNTNAFVFVD
jgi:hypothetical protein